jgi:transposase
MRRFADAIRYIVVTGVQWRLLPRDFPAWRIVYHCFRLWRKAGVSTRIHDGRGLGRCARRPGSGLPVGRSMEGAL